VKLFKKEIGAVYVANGRSYQVRAYRRHVNGDHLVIVIGPQVFLRKTFAGTIRFTSQLLRMGMEQLQVTG
jgi:hypothetical protein